jgi:hypothetical protein
LKETALAASAVAQDQPAGGPRDELPPAELTLRIGLVAAPGLASAVTAGIAEELRAHLETAFPSVRWVPEILTEYALVIPPAGVAELVEAVRQELLDHEWAICVGVTDLPLYLDGRPIVSHVSVTHAVGIVSLPALGALQLPRRLREQIVEVIAELVCEEPGRALAGVDYGGMSECGARAQHVLAELARRDGPNQPLTPLFVIRVAARHVRLLLGMLRANRPWRLAAGLHRALFGAFAVSAFALLSPDVWRIAESLEPLRLGLLAAAAIVGTVVSLIAGHHLWEHGGSPESRPQVVLFNLATTLTVACGVLVLYIAQFAVLLAAALVLLKPTVLAQAVGHGAGMADYLKLVWLAASLATTGGALGAAIESGDAVREAAYAYRPARGAKGSAP